MPRPLARQARRQHAQGIEIEEKVWQLYAKGRRQTAIAAELKLSESRVSRYVSRRLQRIEEHALRNPDELAFMRELIAARLEATIAETYQAPEIVEDSNGEPVLAERPASAPMLAVRLKAMHQLAKLYGLNLSPQPQREKRQLTRLPLEIAAAVNQRILTLHGHPMRSPSSQTLVTPA